jgi:hypothetical protein
MEDSFNIQELNKIKKATSGFFKKKARNRIASSLTQMRKEVNEIYKTYPLKNLRHTEEHNKKFIELLNKYTSLRQTALALGAASYSHPEWSAAAACESWAAILASGSLEEIKYAKSIIEDLINRDS